jgi:23S rRNA pseudoU1915 N3-methylase RlmH
MSKELETQPYRLFKESLDRIINMPDNIKNELVEIFEKKRLEKQNAEEQEKEEEQVVQPEEVQQEEVQQEEVQPEEVQPEEVQPEEVQPEVVQPEEDKNSLFDRFFSQSQSLQPEQKPVLNPPQHKCKIRDW